MFKVKDDAPTPAVVGYITKEIAPYGECLSAAVRYAIQVLALQYSQDVYDGLADQADSIHPGELRHDLVDDILHVLIENRLIVPEVQTVGESIVPVLSGDFVKVVEELIGIEMKLAAMVNEALTAFGLGSRLIPALKLPIPLETIFPVNGAA